MRETRETFNEMTDKGWKIRRIPGAVAAALVLVCMARPGGADTDAVSGPKRLLDYGLPGLEQRVNLTSMEPWDAVQLIEFLAHRGGLNNIVIGRDVSGHTKLKFDDVSVGDALEVVLSVNRLAYEVRSGIITIMTDEEYKARYGTSFYDNKRVRIVELQYADPNRVAEMLAEVRSKIGTVVADPVTGTLVLIDTPEKTEEMMRVIRKTDIATVSRVLPTETQAFKLQYGAVGDLEAGITALLTEGIGSVRSDNRTRTLIVTALPHNMRQVEELVRLFDRRPHEVFIESKIVQVNLSDEYRFGIEWNHLFHGVNPRFRLGVDVEPGTPLSSRGLIAPAGSGIGTMRYNTILGGGNLNLVLDVLRTIGETKILSNPHVAVLDGETATIKVVRDEPYAEAQLESGTTNVVGETIKFIEVGVSLDVTPRINEESMISVAIRPEISSVATTYEARYSVPVVQKAYAETSVMVKDGETIIIGGMIENRKVDLDNRVPVLGRIPLLGLLFRGQTSAMQNSEIIVFLTPRIVSGEEPFQLLRDIKKAPKPLRTVGETNDRELKPVR